MYKSFKTLDKCNVFEIRENIIRVSKECHSKSIIKVNNSCHHYYEISGYYTK